MARKNPLYLEMQSLGITLQEIADRTDRSKSGVHAQLTGVCRVQPDVRHAIREAISEALEEQDGDEELAAVLSEYRDTDAEMQAALQPLDLKSDWERIEKEEALRRADYFLKAIELVRYLMDHGGYGAVGELAYHIRRSMDDLREGRITPRVFRERVGDRAFW